QPCPRPRSARRIEPGRVEARSPASRSPSSSPAHALAIAPAPPMPTMAPATARSRNLRRSMRPSASATSRRGEKKSSNDLLPIFGMAANHRRPRSSTTFERRPMHPFTRAHEPAQPPEGTSFAPLRNIVLTLVASIAAAGCASTDIDEIPAASGAITVGLDVSSRVAVPGRQIVYRVEIHNGLEEAIDISDLEIELSVVPPDDPDTVRLRQSWPYRSTQRVEILPGRHATIPIRPKTVVFKLPLELQYQVGKAGGAQSEFPVDR